MNGWTFCPVDITDAEGTALLPVKGGKRISVKDAARACKKRSIYNYSTLGNKGQPVARFEPTVAP